MWRDSETGIAVNRHDEIRNLRPLKTLPALLTDAVIAEEGFEVVELTEPKYDPATEKVDSQANPIFVDGKWTQAWNIVSLTTEEQEDHKEDAVKVGWEKIKEERGIRQNGGVQIENKWFQTDEASRIQYLSLRMMGESMPSTIKWKTMDNTFIPMTSAMVAKIFSAIVNQDQLIFSVAEQHKAKLQASTNPSQYDFMSDWPTTFNSPAIDEE